MNHEKMHVLQEQILFFNSEKEHKNKNGRVVSPEIHATVSHNVSSNGIIKKLTSTFVPSAVTLPNTAILLLTTKSRITNCLASIVASGG